MRYLLVIAMLFVITTVVFAAGEGKWNLRAGVALDDARAQVAVDYKFDRQLIFNTVTLQWTNTDDNDDKLALTAGYTWDVGSRLDLKLAAGVGRNGGTHAVAQGTGYYWLKDAFGIYTDYTTAFECRGADKDVLVVGLAYNY